MRPSTLAGDGEKITQIFLLCFIVTKLIIWRLSFLVCGWVSYVTIWVFSLCDWVLLVWGSGFFFLGHISSLGLRFPFAFRVGYEWGKFIWVGLNISLMVEFLLGEANFLIKGPRYSIIGLISPYKKNLLAIGDRLPCWWEYLQCYGFVGLNSLWMGRFPLCLDGVHCFGTKFAVVNASILGKDIFSFGVDFIYMTIVFFLYL